MLNQNVLLKLCVMSMQEHESTKMEVRIHHGIAHQLLRKTVDSLSQIVSYLTPELLLIISLLKPFMF